MRSLSETSLAAPSNAVLAADVPKFSVGTMKCVICRRIVNFCCMKPATEVVENKKLLEGMCERFGGSGIPVFCLEHADLWKEAERNASTAHLTHCAKTLIYTAEAFNKRDESGEALDSEGQWHRSKCFQQCLPKSTKHQVKS